MLVIGAGPYGLSLAAYLKAEGVDCTVVGRPMAFWKDHMPAGMLLRSGTDWHLDPHAVHTFEAYVRQSGLPDEALSPLPLRVFLDYAAWFQARKDIEVLPHLVQRLDLDERGFVAALDDGRTLAARRVVVAVGFGFFQHVPKELRRLLPAGRYGHTCEVVDFAPLAGKRCLIVGGRQSALEWAALVSEAGAVAVDVTHRHDTPALAPSDWSWVPPLVRRTVADPGWYRRLSEAERQALAHRFWTEGRLKLEPWLEKRLQRPSIHLWPNTQVVGCAPADGGALAVELDNGKTLQVDHVVLATGYKPDLQRLPFLASGNGFDRIRTQDGFPVLDEHFQSSVPGVYFTSFLATRAFGPFFGFTVGCVAAACVVGARLAGEARSK